jgi:hypothetical protein
VKNEGGYSVQSQVSYLRNKGGCKKVFVGTLVLLCSSKVLVLRTFSNSLVHLLDQRMTCGTYP